MELHKLRGMQHGRVQSVFTTGRRRQIKEKIACPTLNLSLVEVAEY